MLRLKHLPATKVVEHIPFRQVSEAKGLPDLIRSRRGCEARSGGHLGCARGANLRRLAE
jgi:hypothetical protein